MSLRRLSLRDFVIVPALELDLGTGFTALTGETGAGKSILVDALQLVLGARADSGVVREGQSRCEIAAEFDVPPALSGWLDEQGFALAEGGLLLRRQIDGQGRSRAWVNGSPATVAQLKTVGEHLVDIHGQHAWQSLTRPDSVRQLLDAYGHIDTQALREAWQVWRDRLRAHEQAQQEHASRQEERERLQWQINELGKLAPAPGEWEELNRQQSRLAHAQGLQEAARAALECLTEDEGALSRLYRATQRLQEQQHIEPRYGALVEVLQSAIAQIDDACHDLQNHAEPTEQEPDTLEALDQRLGLWLSLARRFRCPPEALPEHGQRWQQRLDQLERDSDLHALQAAVTQAQRQWEQQAKPVSQARQAAAQRLEQAITQAMQGLGMVGGRFAVVCKPLAEPQAHGQEHIEFLVAGHPGSSPKPVAKVASGGELSRIALAISVTTSQLGTAPTLIFDEVDSGIGGTVAQTVGALMRQLGQDRQVLAVTHLPQVAAHADRHWLVQKQAASGASHSTVTPLDKAARVEEIARMLGGHPVSAASLAHAREMLQS